jgi:hypothetical protein
MILMDEREAAMVSGVVDRSAVERYRPGFWLVNTGQQLDERRFPGSVLAQEREYFASLQG